MRTYKTTTSNGADFTKPAFWVAKLDIDTNADNNDVSYSLSGVEVVLDALQQHHDRLYTELERIRDDWAKEVDSEPFPIDDVIRLMEQIKFLSRYINLIATSVAADLREVGNALSKEEVSNGK